MSRLPPLCIAIMSILWADSAQAVDVSRYDQQSAVGLCQAQLPAHRDSLRARPLGLTNDGTTPIFVNCGWQGDDAAGSTRGATRISVNVSNGGTTPIVVNCTLISGFQSGFVTQATYTPKAIGVTAGSGGFIEWVPAEVAGAPATIKLPSVSCQLPPKATLQYTGKVYSENVGS